MADEKSPGGSAIYRHEVQEATGSGVHHADDARITAHLNRCLGDTSAGMVWHEVVSDRIHIDLHMIPASEQRSYLLLVTSGMSATPMVLPPQVEQPDQWNRAELCMLLPADWPMTQEAWADEGNFWPIRLLKSLARLPNLYGTWLGSGHSIPNGDPAEPYAANTQLSGALIVPPYILGKDFYCDEHGDGVLRFYQVVPLHRSEMAYKLAHSTDALLDQLPDAVFGPIDASRPPAC